MNEEERSNLYIYTYSDLDDDFVFAETKYTLGDLHKLQQENQQLQELMSNNKRISNVAEKRYEKILELEQENKILKTKYNKALGMLINFNSLPCKIDNFNTKEENLEYCSQNCSVDESIYIKCWNRFIEQNLKKEVK